MNNQIGKNKNKFSLHSLSNRNGKHLMDFSLENGLKCLNTKFQKRRWKLWTYTYANKDKAQIDYIFMNKKWINGILNCEAYSSFVGVSFNDLIVMAKIQLSLHRNATQSINCPVSWGCRIHQLLLCRWVKHPSTNILNMTLNNLMVRFQ